MPETIIATKVSEEGGRWRGSVSLKRGAAVMSEVAVLYLDKGAYSLDKARDTVASLTTKVGLGPYEGNVP